MKNNTRSIIFAGITGIFLAWHIYAARAQTPPPSCPPSPPPETLCGDMCDNDRDGPFDCADPDCAALCSVVPPPSSGSLTKPPVLDVRSFGKGLSTTNGTDDWSVAIATAMAGLPDTGGEILFPAGVYFVKSALLVNSNVTLKGLGNKTSRVVKGFNGDLVNLGEIR